MKLWRGSVRRIVSATPEKPEGDGERVGQFHSNFSILAVVFGRVRGITQNVLITQCSAQLVNRIGKIFQFMSPESFASSERGYLFQKFGTVEEPNRINANI